MLIQMMRRHLYECLAIAIFFAVSLFITYWSQGERSAWVLTSAASYPDSAFGLMGYNYAMGEEPLMAENPLIINQTLMFSGSASHLSMSAGSVRALYGYLASVFSPFVGIIGGMLVLNYLGWIISAYVAWRFTLRISGDKLAALIAVGFVAAGLGFAIHINDYSTHLIAFAMYYVGLFLIYESRVWLNGRPLKTHLFLASYLALACLCYNTGLYLVGGYALVSIRRNRWWHIAIAVIIALSAQYVWIFVLNLLAMFNSGAWSWTNVSDFEQDQLRRSLAVWLGALRYSNQFVMIFCKGVVQFLFFEFPVVIVLGILAWLVLPFPRSFRWFLVVFFCLPIAGGLAYLHTSTTRGYLVYGISLLLYVPLALWVAQWLRSSHRVWQTLSVFAVLFLFGVQLFWSTAFLWGYVAPLKIFFGFGYLEWIPMHLFEFHLPPAFSLTGAEPTPVMFGGSASLKDAGLFVQTTAPSIKFIFLFALLSRFLVAFYTGMLVVFATVSRRAKIIGLASVGLVLWLFPALLPQLLPPKQPPIFSTFYNIYVPPNETWHYSVTLSDEFINKLWQYAPEPVMLQFLIRGLNPPFDTRITSAGDTVLAHADDGRAILNADMNLPQLLSVLEKSKKIDVYVTTRPKGVNANDGTALIGWQRNGLPGREFGSLSSNTLWSGNTLPTFELHVLDSTGKLLLIGF